MSCHHNFGAQMSPAHAENFALSTAKFSSFRESFARQSVIKDDEDVMESCSTCDKKDLKCDVNVMQTCEKCDADV